MPNADYTRKIVPGLLVSSPLGRSTSSKFGKNYQPPASYCLLRFRMSYISRTSLRLDNSQLAKFCTSLMATGAPVLRQLARKTWPELPSPSWLTMVYFSRMFYQTAGRHMELTGRLLTNCSMYVFNEIFELLESQ